MTHSMKRLARRLGACLLTVCFLACDAGAPGDDALGEDIAMLARQIDVSSEDAVAPMFGATGLFEASGEARENPIVSVPNLPDDRRALRISLTVLWGKFRADGSAYARTNWDGYIQTHGGVTIGSVRSVLFDPEDRIVARSPGDDRIAWISNTSTHRDGLVLELRLPVEATPVPGTAYNTSVDIVAGGFQASIPVRDLGNYLEYTNVDSVTDHNRVLVNGVFMGRDGCQTGTFRGQIHETAQAFSGGVHRLGGELGGWVAGTFEADGKLSGKMIRLDGQHRALLDGEYGEGRMRGFLIGKGGVPRGAFAARYTGSDPAQDNMPTGEWHGRWMFCNAAIAPPLAGTLFDSFNIDRVEDRRAGPPTATVFSIDRPTVVTQLSTYHYDNGGKLPGALKLVRSDGATFGPWKARGLPGQDDVANAFWVVEPFASLPAGTYTVVDSDPATWSYNNASHGAGFARVEGFTR